MISRYSLSNRDRMRWALRAHLSTRCIEKFMQGRRVSANAESAIRESAAALGIDLTQLVYSPEIALDATAERDATEEIHATRAPRKTRRSA